MSEIPPIVPTVEPDNAQNQGFWNRPMTAEDWGLYGDALGAQNSGMGLGGTTRPDVVQDPAYRKGLAISVLGGAAVGATAGYLLPEVFMVAAGTAAEATAAGTATAVGTEVATAGTQAGWALRGISAAQSIWSGVQTVEQLKEAHDHGASLGEESRIAIVGALSSVSPAWLKRIGAGLKGATKLAGLAGEVPHETTSPEPTTPGEKVEPPPQETTTETPPPGHTKTDSYGRTYSLNPKDSKTTVELQYAKGSTEANAEPTEISVGSYDGPVLQLKRGLNGEWEQATTSGRTNPFYKNAWKPFDGKVEFGRDGQGRINSVNVESTEGNTTYEPGSIKFTDKAGYTCVRDENGNFTQISFAPGKWFHESGTQGLTVDIKPGSTAGAPPEEITLSTGEKFVHTPGSLGNDYQFFRTGTLGAKPGAGEYVELPQGTYDVKIEANRLNPNQATITFYPEGQATTGPYTEISNSGVKIQHLDPKTGRLTAQ